MSSEELKDKLVREIDNLPDDKLREVLDFVAGLRTLETPSDDTPAEAVIDPARDPVLKFIGGASHGSLARDIDGELYGAPV
jgi:hypothetical protein